jgi:Lon protease-like protein
MERGKPGQKPAIDFSRWIPIFPLPHAVLLPGIVLPLHVFEDRYRAMTREVLAGDRVMSVALLQSGYEKDYHTLSAAIHGVVGVGRILKEECLPDGRFNFLLQGVARARVIEENRDLVYRRAHLELMPPSVQSPELEKIMRAEIRMQLRESPLRDLVQNCNWIQLTECPDVMLSDLLDILGSALIHCPEEKQKLLEEPSVLKRSMIVREQLSSLSANCLAEAAARRSRTWPPQCCDN